MVFQDDTGRQILILSADLLFIGAFITQFVHDFCSRCGILPADIAIIASHTHYAPATDISKPVLGPVDERYLAFVTSRLRALLEEVFSDAGSGGSVIRSAGPLAGNVNRRLPWPVPRLGRHRIVWGEPVMGPNPRGERDETATFCLFEDAQGAPKAVVWHWACHPSLLPDSEAISADFADDVRSAVRRYVDADIPVIFLQGFAGDLFPYTGPIRIPPPSQWLRTAVFGLSCRDFDVPGHRRWVQSLVGGVGNILRQPGTRQVLSGRNAGARVQVSLSKIVKGCGRDTPVHLARLRAGDALELVMVEAEPLIGLRHMIPFKDALCVGYAETPFGYWPTEKQRRQGGYEASGFLGLFSLSGRLASGLDQVFENAMARLRTLD